MITGIDSEINLHEDVRRQQRSQLSVTTSQLSLVDFANQQQMTQQYLYTQQAQSKLIQENSPPQMIRTRYPYQQHFAGISSSSNEQQQPIDMHQSLDR